MKPYEQLGFEAIIDGDDTDWYTPLCAARDNFPNVTNSTIAARAGLHNSTVGRILDGKSIGNAASIKALTGALLRIDSDEAQIILNRYARATGRAPLRSGGPTAADLLHKELVDIADAIRELRQPAPPAPDSEDLGVALGIVDDACTELDDKVPGSAEYTAVLNFAQRLVAYSRPALRSLVDYHMRRTRQREESLMEQERAEGEPT